MAKTLSSMLPLGTAAPEFELTDVTTGKNTSLQDARGAKATVVMFICAHCPYVIHVQYEIARISREYRSQGIEFVAISANDAVNYPGDSPEELKRQAAMVGFDFPYLYDETQEVAKAYQAECTPDFFVFDENLKCAYRGRLDEATPGNDKSVDGKDLRSALESIVHGKTIEGEQYPSMGCNIKWKN